MKRISRLTAISIIICLYILVGHWNAFAHCDSYDGPVIKDAQLALGQKDVTPILKWISPGDEATIKDLFTQTIALRDRGEDVRKLADTYFFESLVRIHRASEGAGFTGLKPAGSVSPAVAAADKALETGNVEQFADKIASAVRQGIIDRYNDTYERKKAAEKSVQQGREYVESYVQFTHFVEAIHQIVSHGAAHNHQ